MLMNAADYRQSLRSLSPRLFVDGQRIASVADGMAAVDTPMGRLVGRNPKGLAVGAEAILFVRPEALRLAEGEAETGFTAPVTAVAFEGNMSHVFLAGPAGADGVPGQLTVSVGRGAGQPVPEAGAMAQVSYTAAQGLVLPAGQIAHD